MATVSPNGLEIEVPNFKLSNRRFGIEIEFVKTRQSKVTAELKNLGATVMSPPDWRPGYPDGVWQMRAEGLNWYPDCGELVSPPLSGPDGAAAVAVAAHALDLSGAEADESCGLHVHHEATEENLGVKGVALALKSYRDSQEAIESLVAPHRSNGPYCYRLDDRTLGCVKRARTWAELQAEVLNTGRRAFSVRSINYRNTIEIRQREGTVDASEMLAWVAFGQAFLETARSGVAVKTNSPQTLIEVMVDRGGLCEQAAEFLLKACGVPSRSPVAA